MRETEITNQITKSWRRAVSDAIWCHKIADPRYGLDTGTRAVDVISCWNGITVGLEFKIVTKTNSQELRKVRESQLNGLEDIERAGGVGLLIIVHYKGPRDKCAYAVPVDRWRAAARAAKDTGRSSVSLSEFEDCRFGQKWRSGMLDWETEKIQERVDAVIHRFQ
jgi:hypothetical protein